jgi:acetoin utilization deacetylase AcuC-like enzyme
MRKTRFIYAPGFYCDVGDHVFRTEKYELTYKRIIEAGLARPDEFLVPQPATVEQIELVHTQEYVTDLLTCRASFWAPAAQSSPAAPPYPNTR